MKFKLLFYRIININVKYDGYTLYTPGGGFGGGFATAYLKDSNWKQLIHGLITAVQQVCLIWY